MRKAMGAHADKLQDGSDTYKIPGARTLRTPSCIPIRIPAPKRFAIATATRVPAHPNPKPMRIARISYALSRG